MSDLNTSTKFFVSYKYKDHNVFPLTEYTPGEDTDYLHTPRHYVDKIIEVVGEDNIYKGELGDEGMDDLSDDTIDSKLKQKIFDSSVTIVLLSPNMWDTTQFEKDQWIPKEIAYSLRDDKKRGDRISKTNGMLLVVLPDINGSYDYAVVHKDCGVRTWQTDSYFRILKKNMFNRSNKNKVLCNSCFEYHHQGGDHSYIHPVKWHDFIDSHDEHLDHVVNLREKIEEFDLTKTHEN